MLRIQPLIYLSYWEVLCRVLICWSHRQVISMKNESKTKQSFRWIGGLIFQVLLEDKMTFDSLCSLWIFRGTLFRNFFRALFHIRFIIYLTNTWTKVSTQKLPSLVLSSSLLPPRLFLRGVTNWNHHHTISAARPSPGLSWVTLSPQSRHDKVVWKGVENIYSSCL